MLATVCGPWHWDWYIGAGSPHNSPAEVASPVSISGHHHLRCALQTATTAMEQLYNIATRDVNEGSRSFSVLWVPLAPTRSISLLKALSHLWIYKDTMLNRYRDPQSKHCETERVDSSHSYKLHSPLFEHNVSHLRCVSGRTQPTTEQQQQL